MVLVRQLATFGLIGLGNTAITAVAITLLTFAGVPLVAANALGFACGLANSFVMNRLFTFKSKSSKVALPFIVSFGICYTLNLVVAVMLLNTTAFHPIVPQIAGMITYNLTFFVLMKAWVFASATE